MGIYVLLTPSHFYHVKLVTLQAFVQHTVIELLLVLSMKSHEIIYVLEGLLNLIH